MSIVWKVYCITEDGWVYDSNTQKPQFCPNNKKHVINYNTVEIVNKNTPQTINNTAREIINEVDIVNIRSINKYMYFDKRTVLFDLKSFYPLSLLKNIVTSTGKGVAKYDPHLGSEIRLRVEKRNDYVGLQSAERGQYIAGYRCEAGIAVRIPMKLNHNQCLKFGYYDDFNGYYFKLDGNELSVCILNNGIEIVIPSSEFNCNQKLDKLKFSDGNIFKINFSWYGFGNIIFGLYVMDQETLVYNFVPFHSFQPIGSTSTSNPNLPINTQLFNNSSSTATEVFVAGRQFSIIGNVTIKNRTNMYNNNYHIDTIPKILFNIKKKNTMLGCKNKIIKIKINTTEDILLQLYTNKCLPTANFIDNIKYSSESSILIDELEHDASVKDGIIYWSSVFTKGEQLIDISESNILLIEDQPLSIIASTINNSNNADISINLVWTEEW